MNETVRNIRIGETSKGRLHLQGSHAVLALPLPTPRSPLASERMRLSAVRWTQIHGIHSEGYKDGDICRVWSHDSSCSGSFELFGKYDVTERKFVQFGDCGKPKSSYVGVCGEVGSLKVYYSDEDASPAGSLEVTYM